MLFLKINTVGVSWSKNAKKLVKMPKNRIFETEKKSEKNSDASIFFQRFTSNLTFLIKKKYGFFLTGYNGNM
jgi:hypothetical protein